MGGENRQLNGHNLIHPAHGFSAVTNTSFGFTQGLGLDLYQGNDVISGAPVVAHLLTYGQKLFGQVSFLNRIGLDLSVGGVAAVGGDLQAILTRGALAGLDFEGMPKVRLFTLDEIGFQLTGGVGVRYSRYLSITPGVVVQRALQDPASLANVQAIQDAMLQQVDALTIVPAVMLAEGVSALGIQLSAGPAFSAYGSNRSHGVRFGAHAALDLRNFSPVVPVALTAEYALDYAFGSGREGEPGATAEADHTVVGGLFYTGRRDLELGATFTANPKPNELLLLASMDMHYYF